MPYDLASATSAEAPGDPYADVPPPEHPPDQADNGHDPGKSWRPVDLGPYLRGEVRRIEPSIGLCRDDGLRLIYPGKEHSVIGEMESGKSWICLACVAAELDAGHHVVYIHFEESDPTDTVERLRALGVPSDVIEDRFRFVGPDVPVNAGWLAELLDPVPSLVVLDGVNEAMSLHRQAIREEDGAAAFRRRLVKPCTAAGAAVLSADHVGKDPEKRNMGPLGSIHKGNGLTGALIMLENVETFGRGRRGRSRVFVLKDRPGHLRRNGKPTKVPRKTYMGELVVDDERGWKDYLELMFFAPKDVPETSGQDDPHAETDAAVLAVVVKLGKQANTTTIRATSPYGNTKTADALTRLVLDGKLTENRSGRANIFTVPDPP